MHNKKKLDSFVNCEGYSTSSPDWLMKKQTSSLNTGVFLSRKSLASSTMTGSSVSSSSTWRVWKRTNNICCLASLVRLSSPALKGSHLHLPHSHLQSAGFRVGRCVSRKGGGDPKAAVTHRHPSVIAGAAGDEDQSSTPLDLLDVVL